MVSYPETRTYHAAGAVPVRAESATPPISAAEFAVGEKEGSVTHTLLQKHKPLVKKTLYSESTGHLQEALVCPSFY